MSMFDTQTLDVQHHQSRPIADLAAQVSDNPVSDNVDSPVDSRFDHRGDLQEIRNNSQLTETELLAQLRSGNEQCYCQLVRDNIGKMLAIARRYLCEDDAQDAVQETFIKVVENISAFRGSSSLATWMHRIVVNTCLSRLRGPQRHDVSLDSLPDCCLDKALHSHYISLQPDQHAQQAQMKTLLRDCLARMPASYRLVILLRDLEGFTGEETALKLGISANLVKVRLHRARHALRAMIVNRLPENQV